jgi:hypothetical protein
MGNGAVIVENSLAVAQKLNYTTQQFFSSVQTQEN